MDLAGISVAGVETCIEVPSLKLLLDLGRCSTSAVNQRVVLISHGHLDHLGAITQHAARRALLGMAEGVYVVPHAIGPRVEALFEAAGALDGQSIPRQVVPLAPGESYSLGRNRTVRPFETFHRVPSQGYTVWEQRTRLREEFRGLPGSKLGELRRAGATLDDSHEVALLSFTGDTRVDVLERSAELQQTETLVIEASFLDQRVSVPDAREMGHVHLEELIERAALLPRSDVVLSHFSARYQDAEIEDIVRRRLPDELKGVVRLLGKG
ncbi:MAG TPA: MBL fold metallo-hydrolase [Polyangiaceae bacterium]|nr:MBL fold metallo-hydrolase [Polyangiaceae bacterium]